MQATDAELDQHYGPDETEEQWVEAYQRQWLAYDADDLQTAAAEHATRIFALLKVRNFAAVGQLLDVDRATVAARRAAHEMRCGGRA